MKFAHIADCHIGSWRDPKLRDASLEAFLMATAKSKEENVDFILICGDLFNTSLPAIDKLKIVVKKLKELKESDIAVYIIPGSHDFSPSGKTMLDVLENAGLVINVVKGKVIENKLSLVFTEDKKTGAKITGLLGKKGMLEMSYYEALDKESLEQEQGFKIFMFHTALTELKPKELEDMDSAPVSLLPKGFDYYAGGHVHIISHQNLEGYNSIVYPGPLFPNNFKEIEELKHGGFYIYEDGNLTYCPIIIYPIVSLNLNCNNKTPQEIRKELLDWLEKEIELLKAIKDDNKLNKITELNKATELDKTTELNKTIVTIRLFGLIKEGKISDINLDEIFEQLYQKGIYFVMKNTNKLTTTEFEEIKINLEKSNDIEEALIKEHIGKVKLNLKQLKAEPEVTEQKEGIQTTEQKEETSEQKKETNEHQEEINEHNEQINTIKQLMTSLDLEKMEGERVVDFEQRIKDNFKKLLQI